jgi:hypothetical protein
MTSTPPPYPYLGTALPEKGARGPRPMSCSKAHSSRVPSPSPKRRQHASGCTYANVPREHTKGYPQNCGWNENCPYSIIIPPPPCPSTSSDLFQVSQNMQVKVAQRRSNLGNVGSCDCHVTRSKGLALTRRGFCVCCCSFPYSRIAKSLESAPSIIRRKEPGAMNARQVAVSPSHEHPCRNRYEATRVHLPGAGVRASAPGMSLMVRHQ